MFCLQEIGKFIWVSLVLRKVFVDHLQKTTRYIYQNELKKACFRHDVAYDVC